MLKGTGRYTTVASRTGSRSFVAQADSPYGSNFGSVGGGHYGVSASAVSPNMDSDLLDGLLNYRNPHIVRRIYRDIYYHDVIAGGAVDIKAALPFGAFTLTGMSDMEALRKYHSSIENLSLPALMGSLSVDYEVMGAFCAVPNFDERSKTYKTIMPVNLDMCEMTPAPFFNVDPIIDLKFEKDMQKFLKSSDPRAIRIRDMMPEWMKEGITKGKVLLDPSNVVYIPRRAFTTSNEGTSYFRRILPIYVLEKALLRGTIGQAYRRQRPIGMLTAGDEEWEPTNEELNSLVALYMQADMDPTGAYIATRQSVNYQEIRQGQDFWRYDDLFEFAAGAKMRGLGISEILLTGDANFNTMDAAMSVFIEGLAAHRERVTRELYYERLFPNIAAANGFYKKPGRYDDTAFQAIEASTSEDEKQDRLKHLHRKHQERSGVYEFYDPKTQKMKYEAVCDGSANRLREAEDISKYMMPQIQWHKQLKPKGDRDYLDLLSTMQQAGVPVTLRMFAAAGGLSLDDIRDGIDDDLEMRKDFKDYFDEVEQLSPQPMMGADGGGFGGGDESGGDTGGGDSGGGEDDDFGSFQSTASFQPHPQAKVTGSGIRRLGLLNRGTDDPRLQIRGRDGKGRPKELSARTKREVEEGLNKIVAKIAAEHDRNAQARDNDKFQRTKLKNYYHKR